MRKKVKIWLTRGAPGAGVKKKKKKYLFIIKIK
jgi:hypothetical protein